MADWITWPAQLILTAGGTVASWLLVKTRLVS